MSTLLPKPMSEHRLPGGTLGEDPLISQRFS
jgi:hypothetical protein